MKKRLAQALAVVLAATMSFGMVACGSSGGATASGEAGGGESTATFETGDAGAVLTGVDSTLNQGTEDPVYGGSATFYYPKFYNYFDPAAKNQFAYMLWEDCLFMIDWGIDDPETQNFKSQYINYTDLSGQAAESWEVADDYSSITIKIHDNIYFQEKPEEYDVFGARNLTAEDVAYTFNRLLGLDGVTKVECETDWASELYMVDSIEVVDDYTVKVNFNTTTEVALNDFMIQTSSSVGLTGPEWDTLTEEQKADWHYAQGTGAYVLDEYVADNYMQYSKNENYFAEDERHPGNQLPYLDSVKLVYIADSDNILTQFIAGELDWFGGQKSGLLTQSQIAQLQATLSDDQYGMYYYSSGSPAGIALKCNQEPFNDKNVRIALQHAINCDEIWNRYYGESSEVKIAGLWADDLSDWQVPMSDELKAEYTYDPELAKQMLADAGYPDGFSFEIVTDPLTDQDLYVLLQTYLAAVGVDMTITPISEVMEQNAIATDPDDPRGYNGFAGNFTKTADAYGMTVTGGFGNGLSHGNTEYDELYEKLSTADSIDDAATYAQQMDEIYTSEHWMITTGNSSKVAEFMSGRMRGFSGENIYNNGNMRIVFARLWIDE